MKSWIHDPIEIQTTFSPDELVTSLEAMAGDPYLTYPHYIQVDDREYRRRVSRDRFRFGLHRYYPHQAAGTNFATIVYSCRILAGTTGAKVEIRARPGFDFLFGLSFFLIPALGPITDMWSVIRLLLFLFVVVAVLCAPKIAAEDDMPYLTRLFQGTEI